MIALAFELVGAFLGGAVAVVVAGFLVVRRKLRGALFRP